MGHVSARVVRSLVSAGAVLGIVAASIIGLNEWADDAAVHIAPTSHQSDQDPAQT
jgi:hypothetical protein